MRYDAILGADSHIRDDCPTCRDPGEFFNAQWTKLKFIGDLCREHECPFLHAGDFFDFWKPSPLTLSRCLELMPATTYVAPGQHDLPQHNLKEYVKTGLNTLQQAGRVLALTGGRSFVLDRFRPLIWAVGGYGYGETAQNACPDPKNDKKVLLWHHLTCAENKNQPWPGAGASPVCRLFLTLDKYDLIVTGDNHQQFSYVAEGRLVVNPGSMMRQTADQIDFEPAVFGWEAATNTVVRIPLPIKKGVVSRDHLRGEKPESRDLRMLAYIERSKRQFDAGLSFEKNMEQHLKTNRLGKRVGELIWKAIGQ